MDDLLAEFLTETTESLDALDVELVNLEQNPEDPMLIGSIFRLVHTIKGTCGFIGLSRLEKLAHAGENVLGKFRDKALPVTPPAVTLILRCIDLIKSIVADLGKTGQEPAGDDSAMIKELNDAADGKLSSPQPAAAASANTLDADEVARMTALLMAEDADIMAQTAGQTASVIETPKAPAAAAPTAPASAPVAAAKPEPANEDKAAPAAAGAPNVEQSIRVNVNTLEELMTTVSELVLTRNQLLQILRVQKDSDFTSPLQRLNIVVSELQENVMKTRMQPIGNAWSKLPRLVRDLANELHKKIDLEMIGAETELDRQVSEIIRDPLTHMVRNSGDHGIETPAERLAAGKPETGKIKLEAYHEGGHVIIKITDDGKGINIARVRQKAIENGLATEAELNAMPDQQALQYIFRPGFSTAEKVTAVSGRGVGMDVVKTNIEKIGGTVDLQSTVGKGSIFTIKIPLTLAIVSSLIVGAGDLRFAIPQINVVELVTPDQNGETRIDHISNTPVLRLRNRLYPLVSLKHMLKLAEGNVDTSEQPVIVIMQAGSYVFGIIVDHVYDQEEIVVKPMSAILRGIPVFSGNTVLGDGSVVMILDPNGVASTTGEISASDSNEANAEHEKRSRRASNMAQSFLLFRAGEETAPKAVPLSLVARLEDIAMSDVEHSADHFVTQYRGKLMPLIPLPGVTFDTHNAKSTKPVLVFSDRDRSMGMIVDEIVDIVDEELDIQLLADGKGLLGSAILAGHSTDLVDVSFYLTQAFHDWFGSPEKITESANPQNGKRRRVLLVDDSQFFRNMLTPLLTMSGYDVTTVNDGAEALAICQDEKFDVVVSDIEMPGMNGFEFAEKLRSQDKWKTVPMVALSAHSSAADMARGRDVGFDDYVPKYDREALLHTLQQTFAEGVAA